MVGRLVAVLGSSVVVLFGEAANESSSSSNHVSPVLPFWTGANFMLVSSTRNPCTTGAALL
eukprot:7623357-Karenia_brevis.AAC.1